MTETTYNDILDMAQRLDPKEQLQLLESLAVTIRQQIDKKSKRSILELQGLGKEIWKDTDPGKYIQEERESWNG